VPPIIWGALVGDPGSRKTATLSAFDALLDLSAEIGRRYGEKKAAWDALSAQEKRKTREPPEPFWPVLRDVTPEKAQDNLAKTQRGALRLHDELAGLFSFGKYTAGADAERAWLLESYEGNSYQVLRMKRTCHVAVNALAIFGSIQTDRLNDFELTKDGLLQRLFLRRTAEPALSQPVGHLPSKTEFDRILTLLANQPARYPYTATREGSDIIRAMESHALDLAKYTELGNGFRYFAAKLGGSLARLSLLLHQFDEPERWVTVPIAPETIDAADRLVRQFIIPSAYDFYRSQLGGANSNLTQTIASWLLTEAPQRIRASDFHYALHAVRHLRLPQLNVALDPFVSGGWLETPPESRYPHNVWLLDLRVRQVLAHRVPEAVALRERNRRIAQHLGRGK
jgi:hypothetical protein